MVFCLLKLCEKVMEVWWHIDYHHRHHKVFSIWSISQFVIFSCDVLLGCFIYSEKNAFLVAVCVLMLCKHMYVTIPANTLIKHGMSEGRCRAVCVCVCVRLNEVWKIWLLTQSIRTTHITLSVLSHYIVCGLVVRDAKTYLHDVDNLVVEVDVVVSVM